MKLIEAMKAKTAGDLTQYVQNPSWVAEEKFDGTRYLVYIKADSVKIISRRGVEKTDRLPQLVAEIRVLSRVNPRITAGCILDGEVIADGGFLQTMSLVGSLGSRGIHQTVAYRYVIFDLLMIDGKYIYHNPWIKRRHLLNLQFTPFNIAFKFKYMSLVKNSLPTYDFLDEIWARGGEGIMLKHVQAPYEPGKRSRWWLKVKAVETADGVILGYNPGEGKYAGTVGSIQIGQYDPTMMDSSKLLHITNISGMTDELRYSLGPQDIGKVVEFAYQLKTRDSYRHPRFKRFRPDKAPEECIWE